MATPAQPSSPVTSLPMSVEKLAPSLSIMSYHHLFIASWNTTFSSLVETWTPKLVKTNYRFSLHNLSNINGEFLTDFTLENRLTCLNTKFQKREGNLWIYTYANITKAQIDYAFINKKWNNSALNSSTYSSFEGVSSDHWIVTAKIRLSLQRNVVWATTTVHYDCFLLTNRNMRDKYMLTLRYKSETHTPNDKHEKPSESYT